MSEARHYKPRLPAANGGGLRRGAAFPIQVIATVVMGRLFTPGEFGVVGMGAAFYS
jgi:hypothetical protein